MKKIINKQGSTLLMVIIMVAALTILGTALISMTMMNVNMKYNDYRAKKSMYFAEAGIDEVYAIVGKYVDEALVYATNSTATYMNNLIDNVTTSDAIYNVIYYDSDGNYLDGAFNQMELQAIADAEFKKCFKEFFDSTHVEELKTSISAISTSIGGHSAPNITYATISDFTMDDHRELSILGLTSTFTLKSNSGENLAKKTITTDIVINEPTVQYPLQVVENRIAVARNPLWQNAIVSSSGDIQFKRGTTIIAGDIYALGIPAANPLDALNYGGIVVTRDPLDPVTTTVTVTGDVVSKNYVQTRGNSTTLNILDAHVYCNSLTIQETATDSKILIDKSNVYTIDDIELNGQNSEINIDGSYYGYSSGSTFDSSSCIIINSNINTGSGGSNITITGNPSSIDYGEAHDGIYIAGTAYVNTTGDITYGEELWPYQTGESFSLKGNYKAYKYKFDGDSSFPADTLDFASVSGTAMEFVAKEKSSTTLFGVNDKIDYFTEYAKLDSTDLVLGTPDSVNIPMSAYKYTLGAKIGINNNTLEIEGAIGDADEMFTLASNITNDYNFYLYRGGNEGEFLSITAPVLSNNPDDPDPAPDIFTYYTDIETVISTEDTNVAYILDIDETATEIIYVGDEDIAIGPNSSYTYDTSVLGNRLQGIILTDKTVTISSDSDLDFVGTIIAKGDVVIEGSGTKNFYNYNPAHSNSEEKDKYRYLIELIDKNNDLEEVLNENTNNDVISFIQTTYVDVSAGSNSYRDRYNELIDFRNWQVD